MDWVLAKAVKEHDLRDNNDDKLGILPSCYDGMPWTAAFEMVRELAVSNGIVILSWDRMKNSQTINSGGSISTFKSNGREQGTG
jgi:hypothetical protein